MAPENKAAVLLEARAHPMKVQSAPFPTPGAGEIVVKVAATAVNPMDWLIQDMGEKLFNFLHYPFVSGSDVAGTVVEVGPNVDRFKVGDRVMGLAAGFEAKAGAFQNYVVLLQVVTTPIPADLEFIDAAVVPLGLSTAACGLYQQDFLALDFPTVNPKPNGKTLLVWSGASSVGSNAVQLAVASGYEVFTTSSPKNFDFCKALGAAKVFDYKSPTVVKDLIEAFKNKTCAGALCIYPGSDELIFQILLKVQGSKFAACAMMPANVPEGIQAKMIFGGTLKDNEVGPAVFEKFLPAALAQKKYKCVPPPLVFGHGLEDIQGAVDLGKSKTVANQKIVVTL